MSDNSQTPVAGIADRGVARHLRDAAALDPDRRQDPADRSPWLNHSWHVTLYVTPRGLTTSPIPDGARTFQIDFDFIDHTLRISTSDGSLEQFALAGHSVASFYAATLGGAGRTGH